jgi:hypothetical protein
VKRVSLKRVSLKGVSAKREEGRESECDFITQSPRLSFIAFLTLASILQDFTSNQVCDEKERVCECEEGVKRIEEGRESECDFIAALLS